MFGDGVLEKFDEWFSKQRREMFPRDFLWQDGHGFVWYYVYSEEINVPEEYEIVDFPGGLYAVVTGRDNDGVSYKNAMAALDRFIAMSNFEKDPDRAQMGNIITPPDAKAALGYEQMDYYVPIRIK